MPRGRIGIILPPKPDKPDQMGYITPDGAQPRERDIRFYFDPTKETFTRGTLVEYEERNGIARGVRAVAGSAAPAGAAAPAPINPHQSRRDDHRCPAGGDAGVSPILAPKDTAAAVEAAMAADKAVHAGLLLDRFPRSSHIDNQEQQKSHLDAVANESLAWNKDEYHTLRSHLEGGAHPSFCARSTSRLALHLSRAGGLENANICLHPVFGFPYLPGSGLKGLASAYAGHLWEQRRAKAGKPADFGNVTEEQYRQLVEDIFGWAPNDERREATDQACNPRAHRETARRDDDGEVIDSQRGGVVFHDAFAEDPPHIEVDVLTCHYPDYFLESPPKTPGDWQSPRPVSFLTIAADTRFRFRVTATPGTDQTLVEAAKRFLLGGLYWFGHGAKTGSGYGHLELEITEDERKQAKARDEAAGKAANDQTLARLARSFDPKKEALWIPKIAGSGTGYRIKLADDGTWTWEDGWNFGKANPQPKSKDLVYRAEINPDAEKRLRNPQHQAGSTPPAGRPTP